MRHSLRWLKSLLGLSLFFWAPIALSETGIPALTVSPESDGGETWSLSLQALMLMTLLSMLPALMLTTTAFTRIIIVLGLLRQALGTGQTPTNQVLIGLALFLTLFVMMPVFQKSYDNGIAPYLEGEIEFEEAWTRSSMPMKEFMVAQTRDSDLLMFSRISESGPFESTEDVPFPVLAAAFLTSELKTAFQIGFLLFVPFVVIDLVVSSVLMSMGMMMLSPMIISLPFKIMLFVLVDGWVLVLGSLAGSFRGLS